MTTGNKTPTIGSLEAAITQAVAQQQSELAEKAMVAAALQQRDLEAAIATFKLPFDDTTLGMLPELQYRVDDEGELTDDRVLVAYFGYRDMLINLSQGGQINHCTTWSITATRNDVCIKGCQLNMYPNANWVGYSTLKEQSRQFLLFLHEAAEAPTPEHKIPEAQQQAAQPQEPGTHEDFQASQKQRERFIRAAMQGTLVGLTSTGLEAGACLQAALFAVETAEQVLMVMHATPLQRQVLSVLTLERFTNWLSIHPPQMEVGSLANENHPVRRYLKARCGVQLKERCDTPLDCSNVAIYSEDGACVLGHTGESPSPNDLPLNFVGEWLPALLDWKTSDLNESGTVPTFSAREVLEFLKPYQP